MNTTARNFRGALAAILLTAGVAGAQDFGYERRGFSASFGVGAANAGVSCVPRCQGDRRSAPAFMVRGSALVAAQLTLSVEANVFQKSFPTSNGTGRWAMTWGTLNAQWYPKVDEDLFIKGGIGVGSVVAHSTFPTVGALRLNAASFGVIVGIGRDFRLANDFGLTVYADYMATTRTVGLIAESDSGARISADVISIGLAVVVF